MYCWKYIQDCDCATPWLQTASENPDGICSLTVSEFLSLMNQFAMTAEQIKGWKYKSIMMALKLSPLPIIFFSWLQNEIPIDLIRMGLYYKSCHPHLPWAGQQQNNIGRGHSSLWKARTRTSKLGLHSPCAALWCPYRQRALNCKRFARELKNSSLSHGMD